MMPIDRTVVDGEATEGPIQDHREHPFAAPRGVERHHR